MRGSHMQLSNATGLQFQPLFLDTLYLDLANREPSLTSCLEVVILFTIWCAHNLIVICV